MKVMTLELERVALEKVPLIEMSSRGREAWVASRGSCRGRGCLWGQPSESNDKRIHIWNIKSW